MPKRDITDPVVIKFLLENYEVEERRRLNWFIKHQEKIQEAATLSRKPTNYVVEDVLANTMKGGLPTIIRDYNTAARYRRQLPSPPYIPGVKDIRHGNSIVTIGLGDPKKDPRLTRPDKDLTIDPIMRPVEPEVKKQIYKLTPGRLLYIGERNHLKPEDKYYFPECTSWMYGWRLNDNVLPNKSEHCRNKHLTGNLFSRVGPKPDPPYYKSSEIPGPSKCTY